MNHVLPPGTHASIEQPFAAMRANRPPPRPNLLLIHVVGLAAGDIGAYAGGQATPNLDRLARSGTRFTQAYAGGEDQPGLLEALAVEGYLAEALVTSGADDSPDTVTTLERAGGAHTTALSAVHVTLDADVRSTGTLLPMAAPHGTAADLDLVVGRQVAALRRADRYRSTLVLVVGAPDDGRRVPTLLSWPGQVPPRQRHDGVVYTADWVPTLLTLARVPARPARTHGGVDLTEHLFRDAALPARDAPVAAAA